MSKRLSLTCLLACLVYLVFALASAAALPRSYVEDFSTVQYCDTVNTTAWWDTVAGEVKLLPFEITLAGAYDMPDEARGVAISGDYAYVADWLSGLQVIDISDPTSLTLAGSYNTIGTAVDVAISGDHAYVADGYPGLQVIDISNPAGPTLAGSYWTPGWASGVAISGDYAYVADYDSGLQVIDISNPASPTLAGTYDTPGSAYGVALSGDYAYVADYTSGLQVIDISDPTSPAPAGSYSTPVLAHGVALSGDYAYVADWSSGLQVIDISDPTSPTLGGSWDTPGWAYGVALSGDYAYVADRDSGLQVIDISDPTSPTLWGSYDTPGWAYGVAISGDYAYIADQDSGLQVIKVCDPTIPTLWGSCDTPDRAFGVAISGDYAYLADYESGLQVIDIGNPASPALENSCDTPDYARGAAIWGDYAYVADGYSGLQVIDISNPTSPALAGSCDTPDYALGVAISGDYAYVADYGSGLQAIDISNPISPTLAGSCDTPDKAYDVAISGDYAYVADYESGLQVIDITNPASPTLVGSYETPFRTYAVAISGDYAYVADYYDILWVVDISNPISPTYAGSRGMPGQARGVAISGDYAYVATYGGGVVVLDISDPTTPAYAGVCDTPDYACGIAISGDYAYVADRYSGLQVIEVFQRQYDTQSNTAQSLPVDGTDEMILGARLNATYSDSIRWELSADSGGSWQEFLPGGACQAFNTPGSDILWRSSHFYTGGGINPGCTDLEIEWLYSFAMIDSIVDVPADQGGWARIYFTRSGRDFGGDSLQIVDYYVWSRVDEAALAARIQSEAHLLPDQELRSAADEGRGLLSESLRHCQTIAVQDRKFLVSESSAGSGFPPGIWEVVASVPGLQQDHYITRIPTLGDSTAGGVAWSVHCVSAHTGDPSIWYVSPADSGYSVDNLAPAPPSGLMMASATDLAWDECPDDDFNYFTVYGSNVPGLDTTAALIDYTIDTMMDVTSDQYSYYHVTATDFSGNEGDASSVENQYAGVSIESGLPSDFALRQNQPNPFRSSTVISFDLPKPCAVRLEVVDVRGRVVKVLTDEAWPAGGHSVVWVGENDAGEAAGPGVYFVRIEAGEFTARSKMLCMK